jgi:hypothetical protein
VQETPGIQGESVNEDARPADKYSVTGQDASDQVQQLEDGAPHKETDSKRYLYKN